MISLLYDFVTKKSGAVISNRGSNAIRLKKRIILTKTRRSTCTRHYCSSYYSPIRLHGAITTRAVARVKKDASHRARALARRELKRAAVCLAPTPCARVALGTYASAAFPSHDRVRESAASNSRARARAVVGEGDRRGPRAFLAIL